MSLARSVNRNPEQIKDCSIKRAIEIIPESQQEAFVVYLEAQGYTLSTRHNNHIKILSTGEISTIRRAASKLTQEFYTQQRFKSVNMEPVMESTNNINNQANTVSRDELANILNIIYNNQNNSNNNNSNNHSNNNVRVPTPNTYDGARIISVIDNWYASVERYLNFNNFDKTRWVEYGVTLLTGRAQLWYARVTNNNTTFFTWELFKTAMDGQFKPQFAARSARDRLFDLKQTNTIQQYIHSFQDILLEVSITDDEAIDKFIRGLKDRARAHVLMQDPMDLESAYQCATAFESATAYGQSTRGSTSSNSYIDDPMDTSVNMLQQLQRQNLDLLNVLQRQGQSNNFNNNGRVPTHNNYRRNTPLLCFVCDKPGHFARDCYQRGNNRNNNSRTGHNNNYRNNNIDSRTSYNFRNNNNQNNNQNAPKHSFNAIRDQFDPLYNNNNSSNHDNNFYSHVNKDLVDLAPDGGQNLSRYLSLSPTCTDNFVWSADDLLFLNNLQNASPELPLYKTMVGGSDFKILIDSGASTCYVHPKLLSHAIQITDIKNQAVETADGNQSHINKKISFKMHLGDTHEHQEIVNAFVFESKFDVILGRNWLKERGPIPNWFDDTWVLSSSSGGNITLHPVITQKHTIQNINKDNNFISQQLFTSSSPLHLIQDTEEDPNQTDYLLSANQVSRLLKKNEVDECYMLYFINDETGNSSLVSPSDAKSIDIEMDKQWKAEFAKLYKYAFKGDITELPPHRFTRDIIQTNPPDAPPIYHHPYQMSPIELSELQRILADLEKKGLIVPTTSPYGFPILFIRHKTSGKLRMCCDFRSLNKISISQRTPIPRIDECLNQLHGSQYYSQIDLTGAFNQTRLSDADSAKCVISHRYGQHRFLVTPFGLKNSGAYFQGIINSVLKQYIDKFCLVYLDDILIYSKSEKEHKEHVNLVLKALDEAKFIINIEKSHFNIKELTFLGFQISKHGILPSKHKTEAIRNWPIPTNVQQVRQFLGLAQHFRRFIPDFAGIASVITDLTSGTGYKTRSIDWTPACQVAFDLLKEKLCSAPVLSTVDMDKTFRIECDSSDYSVGAVLLQQDDHKIWKPLAFESKRLSQEERSLPAQERELLAILIALRKWRCFIDGKKYQVFTDHLPLKYFRDQKKPVPRLIRWMSEIELYNPDIQYKAGKDNLIPDLLSRRDGPECTPAVKSLEPKYFYNVTTTINTSNKNFSKPITSLNEDPIQDWPLLYFRDEQDWPALLKKELLQQQDKFVSRNQHIYRLSKLPNSSELSELKFVPFNQRADSVDNFHTAFGHLSQHTVYQQMKSRVWWPNMHDDITNWLKSCPQCQMSHRAEKNIHHSPMKPLDIPPAFSRWHLDFIGELPTTKNNNRWILVAVDYATNWPILRALNNATGEEIVKFIYEEIVLKFGNPVELFTDRGANFLSKVLKQYMNKIRSKHTFTSAYHPRSNSKCERVNQIIKSMLKKYVNGNVHSWDDYIDTTTFACRIRKHTTTGHSPFFLVYGVHPRIPGDFSKPYMNEFTEYDANLITEHALTRIRHLREVRFVAEENMRNQGIKDKEKWDELIKGKETQVFNINDYVLLRNESKRGLEYNWMGPYQIINSNNDFNVYQIKEIEGNIYNSWVHTDRLKPIAINNNNTNNNFSSSWYIPRIARAQ